MVVAGVLNIDKDIKVSSIALDGFNIVIPSFCIFVEFVDLPLIFARMVIKRIFGKFDVVTVCSDIDFCLVTVLA